MGNAPSLDGVMGLVEPLIDAGFACHWLRPRNKMPLDDGWSTAPRLDADEMRRRHVAGANIGVRLGEPSRTASGYLHVIDLDIRRPEAADEAWAALRALLPDADDLPTVISGSGGASRHLYFFCAEPFRKRKLGRSDGFDMVEGVKKRHWEIDVMGTGSQVVLPPSIHPDTGLPYRWDVPLDADEVDLGMGPEVPADTLRGWGLDGALEEAVGDDLLDFVRQTPLDLDDDEVDATLADLPEWWVEDRDTWVTAGAALHHQYGGSDEGFAKWAAWSAQSSKWDERNGRQVWRSFRGAAKPVRMATLIQAAGQNRVASGAQSYEVATAEPVDLDGLDDDADDLAGNDDEPEGPPWTSLLAISDDGQIKTTLPNVELIVSNDPRTKGIVGYNAFTHELVVRAEPKRLVARRGSAAKPPRQLAGPLWEVEDRVNGKLWTDSHDNAVRLAIEAPKTQGGYGIKVSDRDLRGAVDAAGQRNIFHPVRDVLEGLVWDGRPRMDRLFVDYLGAPDTPYHREVARLTLLGAVSRIYRPGHKFDFVPILEGIQGAGKSTFIRILGLNWAAELVGDFSDTKEMVELMQGAWVMEIPELEGFSKNEVTTLKAFVSKQADKARLAYERRARVYPRQCILIGSTNDGEYLRDATGGRRFWPVECRVEGMIDNARFRGEVHQFWAEAVAAYKALEGEHRGGPLPLYLRDEQAAVEAKGLQEDRRVETAEEGLAGAIEAWLERADDPFDELEDAPAPRREQVSLVEIWCEMMGGDKGRFTQREALMLGRAMKFVPGWKKAGDRPYVPQYGRQRVYRRA